MALELSKEVVVSVVSNAVAAGVTAVTSGTAIDMAGFDAVSFIVKFNTVVDTSVLQLQAFEVATNAVTGGTLITGATAGPFNALGSSNTTLVLDVIKPKSRYVYVTLTRTTANATVDSIIALQYRGKNIPVTQPATVIGSALSSPEA